MAQAFGPGGVTSAEGHRHRKARKALLELLAAYLGQSAAVRRSVALHAATVDVLFELLLEDANRGLSLGMVRRHRAPTTVKLAVHRLFETASRAVSDAELG